MPSASEFSATPASNTVAGPTNIAENCPPGGLNDALRYVMAALRSLYDQVQGLTASMPLAGGAFTGDITRTGQGGYFHHANSAQTDGRIYFLATGSARPTPAEGVTVFYY